MKRHMLAHAVGVVRYRRAFLGQVGVDRASESRIRDPMGRPGRRRLETASDLVFALRSRFETLQSMFDAEPDATVEYTGEEVKVGRGAAN